MNQWVYSFGNGQADGNASMRNLLGGKGANLAEMSSLGLPVPPGFTLTSDVCDYYTSNDNAYPNALKAQVAAALFKVEAVMGLRFGEAENTLLVSVRSGARVSMPGMMDTVLNLGLNDKTVRGLAKVSGDERFAYDSYRRFLQMYGDVVLGVEHHMFEDLLEDHKSQKGIQLDTDMESNDWRDLVDDYKKMVQKELGSPFPQDPHEQLWGAIDAVFGSWMNHRAKTYRMLYDIPEELGTAVNVQAMVFGNMGNDCATGVAFTRDPANGRNEYYGEYLVNAQGEDVVAGIRTPQPLNITSKHENLPDLLSMEERMPEIYTQLLDVRTCLEQHYKDMQDIEFTVQKNSLWMLQTRNGARTIKASLKIATDMVEEGLINKAEAILRIDPSQLDQILHPTLDSNKEREILGIGLPASPGAASGRVVFNSADAAIWAERGNNVILVRTETSPEDIGGMHVAKGIVTTRGGMTSHAAVIARGMGTPCVSGVGSLIIDYDKKNLTVLGQTIKEGEIITIDGTSGEVIKGEVPTIQPEFSDDLAKLMQWVDEIRTMDVRANVENAADARTAREFGAEGIGLCRTEHMFFDAERIIHVREMIVAKDENSRRIALDKLLPFHRQDFVDLFTIMDGLPVTIRLLDPPLHEFLPTSEVDIANLAKIAGIKVCDVKACAAQLYEFNPMLGHRGCRLGITHPEIYEMQARAIFEAASDVIADGIKVKPEVMISLVAIKSEFDIFKKLVENTAEMVKNERSQEIDFTIGAMIELPRAVLRAGEIAETAEFFSFGTNDLTQTALGLSRDDSSSFIQIYCEKSILETDPFVSIDIDGVGELVKIAVDSGRAVRENMMLGVCGEHGGDPASIEFFHKAGLDYVSCSPYRVPIARLAAAQAALGLRIRDST
jgi:pyruvate,orthophosphate dikinase